MSAYRGVRIADFSQGVAGPMAAMLLGDYEAEVVKVEPPGGDRWKDRPGYLAFNRNKQVVTLDLEADAAAVRALIAGADVAIFDQSPQEIARLGLDGPTLTAAHPALVHAWMPPYGTTGKWSELPARHSLLTALTGISFRQGAWGDNPIHLVLPLVRYGQAVMGAAAIGAALYERGRSGRGQAVTVSGLHGAAEVSGAPRLKGVAPLPRPIPPGANPRYRLYQCSDGQWFFLGTLFDNFYRRAVEVVGFGDLFETFEEDMLAARDLLTEVFLTRPLDEWLELLKANDIPCAPTGTREAWFDGETVRERGLRTQLLHPELGPVDMPTPPAKLSGTPASIRGLAHPVSEAPAWSPRSAGTAIAPVAGGPLAGVRVLNLGTVIAGAYSGALLANLGAEVIKIEPREADPFRSDNPGFLAYNRGQRGLGLDLKKPEARALFLELAKDADVVIDNYRLGVRSRLGIDYAALKAVNPRIISCSLNAYGEDGPRAALPGFDPLLQAEGGMMQAQGGDGDPILHTIPVNDVASAASLTAAIVAALNARERTGEGQEIVSSLAASSLLFQLGEVVTYAGRAPNDLGGRDCLGVSALVRFYPCAEKGWLALACETEEEAEAAGRVLGVDVGAQPLKAPRDGKLAEAIQAVTVRQDRDALVDALMAAGVPAAPALRSDEAFGSQWLWDNRYLERSHHNRLGELTSVTGFADFDRTPGGFRHPTPECGEHTRELLREFGLGKERIDALFAAGAVFQWGDVAAVAAQ